MSECVNATTSFGINVIQILFTTIKRCIQQCVINSLLISFIAELQWSAFFRKLFVASTIFGIRHFVSNADEYGSALRQFYFAVHPDFFEQYPVEKVSFAWISFLHQISNKNKMK